MYVKTKDDKVSMFLIGWSASEETKRKSHHGASLKAMLSGDQEVDYSTHKLHSFA